LEETTSLTKWRLLIRQYGSKQWVRFYQEFLGVAPSSYPRFYRAIKLYGDWPVFEAIVEASGRELTGDPLAYVLKVANSKWREEASEQDSESEYVESINRAKERSRLQNAQLQKKIKAAKPRTRRKK
jgi:hypothetical protein